jgi:dienelactone hydrolase
MLASPEGAKHFNSPDRFRATVGNYGSCGLGGAFSGAVGSKIPTLSEDSDRPLLMLMAEQDIEAPPSLCFPLLEQMKRQGKPVEWHIYPNTTHAWDKAEHHGHVFQLNSGETMTYRYDVGVALDATRRMIEFFNQHK